MSWATLATNQMVTEGEAATSPWQLMPGQAQGSGTLCMTKLAATTRYSLLASNLTTYASNQLIPKSVWADGPDVTPPSDITNLVCTIITDEFGGFTHSIATDNVGIASLGWYDSSGTLISLVNAGGTSFAYLGLSAYTTFTMKLKAKDTSNNYSVNFSNTITFRTLPARVNPTLGSITSTSMVASWTNSTGATSVDMRIWDNTTSTEIGIFTSVTSPYTKTGLTMGNSYTFFLRMNDSTNTINQTGEWSTGGTTATTSTNSVTFSSYYSISGTSGTQTFSGTVTITGISATFKAYSLVNAVGPCSVSITVGGNTRTAYQSGVGTNYSTTFTLAPGTYSYNGSVTISGGYCQGGIVYPTQP